MAENCLLTVITQRSSFYEILDYEFHRAVKYNNVMTLMFIKLYHLDEIIRNRDQLSTERIISEIEHLIRSNIRNTDRGFMYGKDEYMIILPNTPKSDASRIIPKLKQILEGYHFTGGKGKHVALQVKFGIASYPHHIEAMNGEIKHIENHL
jgi:diguanylate cyclase (GGDEF)-like protein